MTYLATGLQEQQVHVLSAATVTSTWMNTADFNYTKIIVLLLQQMVCGMVPNVIVL